MMNGSQRGPAKTRTPAPDPPPSSPTPNETVSPAGIVQVPSCSPPRPGEEKTQSKVNSSAPEVNGASSPGALALSGRSRKRYVSPSDNRSDGFANGRVFITSTSRPGRSGLGNAYTSVMSAIGSARARGPEM